MSYVNFKEEKFKTENQLKVRRENNAHIIKNLTEHKESLNIEYDKKYSFRNITDRVINNSKTLKEDEFLEIANETIICARFINCKFYNIKFKECNFYGCIFENCDFSGGGVIFENCTLVKVETEKTPSLNVKENLSCEFINCNMYVRFQGSDISYLIIEESLIKNTILELTNMRSIIINKCNIDKMEIVDSDLSSGKFLNNYMIDFSFNDNLKTKMDEKTFFDKITLKYNNRDEYEGIYEIYENIADKFKDNNLKNNFGEYYYLCRNVQRKSLKIVPKFFSYINWIATGYGERVLAPFITSLIIIIICAIAYLVVGIDIEDNMVRYGLHTIKNFDIKTFIFDFNEAFTLSVGMFAGVGVVNCIPGAYGYVIANIEMILGFIMIGIAIGTLTRRFVR